MRLRLAAYIASEDWRKKYDYVWDYVGYFLDGLATVRLGDKWGFVNMKGEEVVPPKYDKAYDFHEGFARVRLNGKHGFINHKGKEVIKPKYDYMGHFREGLALVKLNGKHGFINTEGKEVAEPKYGYEDLESIQTYVKLGGDPVVILDRMKEETV